MTPGPHSASKAIQAHFERQECTRWAWVAIGTCLRLLSFGLLAWSEALGLLSVGLGLRVAALALFAEQLKSTR